MFFAFLSMTLFPGGVILYFLEKGHSHMAPDRIVSYIRRSFKGLNLFHPSQLVDRMNSVKNVTAEYMDFTAENSCMFEGWGKLLTCCLHDIPYLREINGYTRSHFFEFRNGLLEIRNTHEEPILYTHSYVINSETGLYSEVDAHSCGKFMETLIFRDGKSFGNATVSDIRISGD